jgi:hypothetical protein
MKNNRRDFLKNMLLTSGGLVIGFNSLGNSNAEIISLENLKDEL